MATAMYLLNVLPTTQRADNTANLAGTATGWGVLALGTARGSGVVTSTVSSTVTGPTNGIEVGGSPPSEWISEPVGADVTISGTITANLWASESSLSANVAINVVIDIIRATDGTIVQIAKSTRTTELATTRSGALSFTTGMASGNYTAQTINRGDRIRIRIFGDDAGTMATGFNFSIGFNGATAGADGDSHIDFTENIVFEPVPLIQQDTSDNDNVWGHSASANQRMAQSFTATGPIGSVALRLAKNGSPTDNVICEIQTDSGGLPSGTVLASDQIAGSSITTTLAYYSFNVPATLTASTLYWIVLRRSGAVDGSNFYLISEKLTTNPYASGSAARMDTSTWVADTSTTDRRFKVFGPTTTIYLTDTASDVSTASVDREAWTSRGAGVQTDVTNTATGYAAPIQVTDTAGGTVVDWFTKPLAAMTLGGMAQMNLRALESNTSANASLRVQIARVNNDGTGATVWGSWCSQRELSIAETVETVYISGDDLAISDGQRLRIRLYIDDLSSIAMATGFSVTTHYAGTSAGASGDTYIVFPGVLTVAYPDSATVLLDLQASGTEAQQFMYVDSATVLVDLQSSGTEIASKRTTTARVQIASGSDPGVDTDHYILIRARKTNAAHQGTIRAELYQGAASIYSFVETSNLTTSLTTYTLAVPSVSVASITDYSNLEVRFFGLSVDGDPTVFEVAEVCVEYPASTAIIYTDSDTVYVDLQSSGTEQQQFVESASVLLDLQSSGTELQEAVDADTVLLDLQASGAELQEAVDASIVLIDLQSSGTEVHEIPDAATVLVDLQASGTELQEAVDATTVLIDLQSSGTEIREIPDVATVLVDLQSSGTEFTEHATLDADTVLIDLQTSDTQVFAGIDAATVLVDLQNSGVELQEAVDAFTVLVDLQASGTELAEAVEAASVYFDLQISDIQVFEGIEAASVYLDLDASGSDVYTPPAGQQLCPASDVTTTGWTTTPLWSKVSDASDATFITATAV